jgi:hypothetical protein
MRTLAATYSSRNEAEAACRRLEAIGIARDRIILKDVAPAAAGPEGGVFLSVKVTTEQVQPAGEILKGRSAGEERAAPDPAIAAAAAEPAAPPPRPLPAFAADPAPALARSEARPQPLPGGSSPAAADRARRGRYLIYYGFALLAAFIFGAWLGLVS